MTEITELLDRLTAAAAAPACSKSESPSTWVDYYTRPVKAELESAGIVDDRLAASISLAIAEQKLATLSEKGVSAPPALVREIREMEKILNV